jgi:hypothetical protein
MMVVDGGGGSDAGGGGQGQGEGEEVEVDVEVGARSDEDEDCIRRCSAGDRLRVEGIARCIRERQRPSLEGAD